MQDSLWLYFSALHDRGAEFLCNMKTKENVSDEICNHRSRGNRGMPWILSAKSRKRCDTDRQGKTSGGNKKKRTDDTETVG